MSARGQGCRTKVQHMTHMMGWWSCGILTCFGCSNWCGTANDEENGCCCVWGDHNKYCQFGDKSDEKRMAVLTAERAKWEKDVVEINTAMKHLIARQDKEELSRLTIIRDVRKDQVMS